MYLKCFGGPFDQQKHMVHNDLCRQGQCWEIRERPKLVTKFDPYKMPEIMSVKCYIYIVETIRVKSDKFIFLRFEPLPIEELFAKIFT